MTLFSPNLSRRSALLGAAALPATGMLLTASSAQAGGHVTAQPNAIKHSFTLGDLEIATLLSGARTIDNPQSIFGMNASAEAFAAASRAAFIPDDAAQLVFSPVVVKAGDEVILFDTGLSAASMSAPLAAAGYTPDDIDVVVLTHMHGDHIGGMTDDSGAATFPNARYVTGQVEYDAWATRGDERFDAKVRPFAEKMQFIGDGDDVASGITAVAAFGHTPGHMVYRLSSGDKQMLILADLANHHVWSLGYPDWEVRFDMDKSAAAASRRRILDMAATDRIPVAGYHLPFPGVGYIDTREDGFEYVAASYQLML